jgi:hypothetical protein
VLIIKRIKADEMEQHIIFIGQFIPCFAKPPFKTFKDGSTEALFRGSIIKTHEL